MSIIDISRDIARCSVYPGDPETHIEAVSRMADGAGCNLAKISMGLHNGTHADAPLHFVEDGDSIDKVDLDRFFGECAVIEVEPGPITGEYVEENFPNEERILVKSMGRAWFLESAATELALRGIKLIGTDALSVGTKGDQVAPHRAFLTQNIGILESLKLDNVMPGRYFLSALPLKIGAAEASPVRAVLIDSYIFWGGSNNKQRGSF